MILVASAASAIEPIRVGVSGPFTGGSSPMGIAMRDGIRLAAQEINDEGGIFGRPLQLVERDDEARPERGALVVQELINREKVVAGLGIVNTGVALASQRYYQQARIPMITSVATGSVVTNAGLVFAFTMSSMIISELRIIGQVGTTIGLGLLFDTLVVRSFMMPSIAARALSMPSGS